MTSSEEIRKAIAVLRYHNRLKVINDPDYVGSTFEADTLDSISSLAELHKRMTESNRSDFIGGEI
uniref:Phage protein n=1 Tax=Klebsiella phage FKP3 TaxID=3231233 RepID=A0AAU8HZ57_9CAUD